MKKSNSHKNRNNNENNKEKEKKIVDKFLNKIRNKIKISKRTGEAYLPLNIIWAMKRKEGGFLEFEGLPWVFGAYTDNGTSVQDEMQNTILYGHLYWSNNTVYLDKDFNVNKYIEHIIECPKCHQKYSDMFSNFSPSKNKRNDVCTLCKYAENVGCCGDRKKCTYEYKKDVKCEKCFFIRQINHSKNKQKSI